MSWNRGLRVKTLKSQAEVTTHPDLPLVLGPSRPDPSHLLCCSKSPERGQKRGCSLLEYPRIIGTHGRWWTGANDVLLSSCLSTSLESSPPCVTTGSSAVTGPSSVTWVPKDPSTGPCEESV